MLSMTTWLRQRVWVLPRWLWIGLLVAGIGAGGWLAFVPHPAPFDTTLAPSPRGVAGQPLPLPAEAISADTAGRVAQLARLGAGGVHTILPSTNGRFLAVAFDAGITVYDAHTLQPQRAVDVPSSPTAAAVAPDGRTIAAAVSRDGAVRIWHSDDRVLRLHGPDNTEEINELRFSPDGSLLAGEGKRTIYLWRAADGAYLRAIPQRGLLGFPTNDTLITTNGTTTQLWRLNGWRVRADEIIGSGVVLTDDGQTLVTTDDARFRVWRVADASLLHDVPFEQAASAAVTVSADGRALGALVDGVASLLRVADGASPVTQVLSGTQIRTLAFAPDGQTVAALTQTGAVALYRIADGMLLRTFEPSAAYNVTDPRQLVWSEDGQVLAQSLEDQVLFWRVADGTRIRAEGGRRSAIASVGTFTPDSAQLSVRNLGAITAWDVATNTPILRRTSGYADLPAGAFLDIGGEAARVWRLRDGIPPPQPDQTQRIGGLLAPNGAWLAQDANTGVQLWRVADGTRGPLLRGAADTVQQTRFSSDSTLIAAATQRQITVWRVADGTLVQTLSYDEPLDINAIAVAPDGATVLAGAGNTLFRWRIVDGQRLDAVSIASAITDISFAPDGALLATAHANAQVQVWRANDLAPRQIITLPTIVRALTFAPDGAQLATVGDGLTQVWPVDSTVFAPLGTTPLHVLRTPIAPQAAVFSDDGTTLLMQAQPSTLWRWQISDGTLRDARLFAIDTETTTSADGLFAATTTLSTTLLWNRADGRLLHTFDDSGGAVTFALDGKTLATSRRASPRTISVWRVADYTLLQTITLPASFKQVKTYGLNVDGTLIAVAEYNIAEVQVYRVADGTLLRAIQPPDAPDILFDGEPQAIALSPDGSILAVSSDRRIHLWRVRDGILLQTLAGHQNLVFSLAFAPDSRLLASGSGDGTVRVWAVR